MQFKIYTDGSYRDEMWGAGAILIAPNGAVKKYSSYGKDEYGSHNVTGEVNAVINSLRALFHRTLLRMFLKQSRRQQPLLWRLIA